MLESDRAAHSVRSLPRLRGTKPSVHRVAPGSRIIARSRSLVRDTQSSCPGRVQRALLRERNETRDPARESRSAILVGPNMLWKKGDAVADGAKVKLQTMLGNYPNTKALKSGEIRSDLVDFDFVEVKVANNLFKKVVREAAYDVAELAIVTYLQAKTFGKPYVLLPAVVVGRGQHHTIAYNGERGVLKPSELAGKRVGVRAYTVTTGTWVRGILAQDYGVDLDKVEWITFEDPHVAEYRDPDWVKRAPPGKELIQMLLDGELDAAVVGDKLADPRLRHLIPDADEAARKWALAHGGVPINHMVVLREDIARSRPDVAKELFRLLLASKRALKSPSDGSALDPLRFGVEACRPTLEIIIDYCVRQKLLPQKVAVDALFDDVTRALAP